MTVHSELSNYRAFITGVVSGNRNNELNQVSHFVLKINSLELD
jgi:hypothetical protein